MNIVVKNNIPELTLTTEIKVFLVSNLSCDLSKVQFSHDFIIKCTESERGFTNQIIKCIDEAVGLYHWASQFKKQPGNKSFLAYMYVDNFIDYVVILSIIRKRINSIKFSSQENSKMDKAMGAYKPSFF